MMKRRKNSSKKYPVGPKKTRLQPKKRKKIVLSTRMLVRSLVNTTESMTIRRDSRLNLLRNKLSSKLPKMLRNKMKENCSFSENTLKYINNKSTP